MGINGASVSYVTEYKYGYEDTESLNDLANLLGKGAFEREKENCYLGKKVRVEDDWLDLYNAPTVQEEGRLVAIPVDRKRGEGTSWKSEEYKYTAETNYINEYANDRLPENLKPEVRDYNLMKTKVYGVDRYWMGVGPRVMDEDYPYVKGKQIDPDKMKYGTLIDSNHKVCYVPGIVGDIKEHTLSLEDGKAVNGIYQTGVSWVTGNADASDDADGAMIEFIRAPHEKDNLIRTPEFEILGIIVYDKETQ